MMFVKAFVCGGFLCAVGQILIDKTKLTPARILVCYVVSGVVLGGLGNIWGSLISAALLTVLPELLRAFESYRMLVYAVVLILVMLATNSPVFQSLSFRRRKEAS